MTMANKPTVLVVDDDKYNRELLESILDDDYQVKSVGSGKECLSAVLGFSPDIILLDVNMPNMDGYKTCSILKNNSATKDIPVVFVTASSTVLDRLDGFEAGGDDFITKPIDVNEIIDTIKMQLEYRH